MGGNEHSVKSCETLTNCSRLTSAHLAQSRPIQLSVHSSFKATMKCVLQLNRETTSNLYPGYTISIPQFRSAYGGRTSSYEEQSIRPSLHEGVLDSLGPYGLSFDFYEIDDSYSTLKEHDTSIMGRFTCINTCWKEQEIRWNVYSPN